MFGHPLTASETSSNCAGPVCQTIESPGRAPIFSAHPSRRSFSPLAPCDPPITRIRSAAPSNSAGTGSFSPTGSGRTGLPESSCGHLSAFAALSSARKTLRAKRLDTRFATPATAFCSCR